MSIIRVKKDKNNPYLIMNKTGLNDNRLSLRAKGLLCYLLSKPDNWYINTKEISSNSSNGIRSVLSTINELVKFGYMYKHRFRSGNGAFHSYNYLVYERPESPDLIKTTTSPQSGFAVVDNAGVDNALLLINNKEVINKDPLTTLSNKSNNVNVVKDDQCLKEAKKQTSLLLDELYIKNHQILFDTFDNFDIFTYADWMLTFKARIKNPTGFIIAALKDRWLDVNKYWKLSPDNDKDPS